MGQAILMRAGNSIDEVRYFAKRAKKVAQGGGRAEQPNTKLEKESP
jgi:hypothetical protein